MIRIRIESNKYKPHNDKFFFFFLSLIKSLFFFLSNWNTFICIYGYDLCPGYATWKIKISFFDLCYCFFQSISRFFTVFYRRNILINSMHIYFEIRLDMWNFLNWIMSYYEITTVIINFWSEHWNLGKNVLTNKQ